MELVTPAFQPYRGATGRAWMAQEYGITADTSSLISSASGTERYDTDEEVCSFDLGPEPYDLEVQGRLPSDKWKDDYQQGLVPGGAEPRKLDYNKYLAMPRKPSILDMMRQEIDDSDEVPPTSPERAHTPTGGFEYDYATDRTSGYSARGGCAHAFHPVSRPAYAQCAIWTNFVTATPTLIVGSNDTKDNKAHGFTLQASNRDSFPTNIASPRAPTMEPQSEPDSPSPTRKTGRNRGRGKWRAPQMANPGVGTRSKTKKAELDQVEATQAQASRAVWPPRPDITEQLQRMTHELQIADRPQDVHRDMLRIIPVHKVDQNQNVVRPPAVGIHTQQQDIFFIPPPRVVGGALGSLPL